MNFIETPGAAQGEWACERTSPAAYPGHTPASCPHPGLAANVSWHTLDVITVIRRWQSVEFYH